MDVKEIKGLKPNPVPQTDGGKSLQRSAKSLTSTVVNVALSECVSVEISQKSGRNQESSKNRERSNEIIGVINFADQATKEIEKLVDSVGGIVEQADSKDLSPDRIELLEKEANELLNEVRKRASSAGPNGKKPLSGESIELKIEEEIGKTLEVILPDDARDSFGIESVKLSTKDTIIQTRANIEEARTRLEQLKEAVNSAKGEVERNVAELEVALQNNEAASSSIRDLENALGLGADVSRRIVADPASALGSVGPLEERPTPDRVQ